MQSDIISYIYTSLANRLTAIGAETNCFSVGNLVSEKCAVTLSILDICQVTSDKTGQRIIVDEKRYEVPAAMAMIIRITASSSLYSDSLKTIGIVASYMKDNPVLDMGEYNWHGNECCKVFFEPVVRNTVMSGALLGDNCLVSLDYRVEFGVNSLKGEEFTRVQKRDVRSGIKGADENHE